MLTSATLVGSLVVPPAAMAAVVAIRPSITNSNGGRMFAFAAGLLLHKPLFHGLSSAGSCRGGAKE